MRSLDNIINEIIDNYLNENLLMEDFMSEKKQLPKIRLRLGDLKKAQKEKDKDFDDEDKDDEKKSDKPEEKKDKKKKKKKFRKNALKSKNGLRKDFDTEEDETYNQNVDDQEQSSVKDMLTNGFINIKKVAEKLYPDHTPEGAQSQLNKKLKGDRSDSGSIYKLKSKEVKKLRHIIASYLS